jgi:predicted nucleic acid-binding protein
MELGDVFVILDDRKARLLALQLSLKVIGTVGMLLRAKRFGVITEIKPLLNALNQVDFRISEALVQKALQIAGEV